MCSVEMHIANASQIGVKSSTVPSLRRARVPTRHRDLGLPLAPESAPQPVARVGETRRGGVQVPASWTIRAFQARISLNPTRYERASSFSGRIAPRQFFRYPREHAIDWSTGATGGAPCRPPRPHPRARNLTNLALTLQSFDSSPRRCSGAARSHAFRAGVPPANTPASQSERRGLLRVPTKRGGARAVDRASR